MTLGTGVCQLGGRAIEEAWVREGRQHEGGEVKAEGSGFGGWRTGSFKPVGDGFEDGVLFCRQKASAFFIYLVEVLILLLNFRMEHGTINVGGEMKWKGPSHQALAWAACFCSDIVDPHML